MVIAVILRQVPDTEANIVIDSGDSVRIVDDDIKWIVNPYDEFAVEAAVSIAEDNDAETIAICIGPEKAESVIRTAMAMGIDAGLLIADPAAVQSDVINQAKIIAHALKDKSPDIVLCGREFIDTGDDAMAAAIAEYLNIPHVLNVSKLQFENNLLSVEREVDGGTWQIEMNLPGVVSCQKGLNEPRYPNLMAVRRAQKKPLDIKSLSDIGLDAPPLALRCLTLSSLPPRSAGKQVKGDSADTAKQAAEWLVNDVRAL